MTERGNMTKEARRIMAEHGVSLRQAYRYAASGRTPSDSVRQGVDGRRYHVHLREKPGDEVRARRIRYEVAGVARRAAEHGITAANLAELELAARQITALAASWRASRPRPEDDTCVR